MSKCKLEIFAEKLYFHEAYDFVISLHKRENELFSELYNF